jgi:rhodanese-related sulfurtransferase
MLAKFIQSLASPMIGVFVVSVALGFAYNAASPLGVQLANAPARTAPGLAPRAKVIPATGYFNETISLTLEGAGPFVAGTGTGIAAPVAGTRSVPTLTWPEVKASLRSGQILLIDARVASYYQAEHIPSAISLPANSPPPEIAAFAGQHPKDTATIIYCGSFSCPMAQQLADALIGQHGYSNVKVMPGGFAEYRVAEAAAGSGGAR